MGAQVNVVYAAIVLAVLLVPSAGQAANPAWDPPAAAAASVLAGESFMDYATKHHAEEPSYSVPANFPGPLVPQPRREPETSAMLLACLGVMFFLGRRRQKASERL